MRDVGGRGGGRKLGGRRFGGRRIGGTANPFATIVAMVVVVRNRTTVIGMS
jgi:hypothetical protein